MLDVSVRRRIFLDSSLNEEPKRRPLTLQIMRGSETHYSANHNTYRICCPLQFCLLQREIVSHMLAAFLHDKLTHQFAKLARNEKPQPRSAKDYVSLKP